MSRRRPGVLFVGQAFYHHFYLSRELRRLGWRADVLNFDRNPAMQGLYHGEDHRFAYRGRVRDLVSHGSYFARAAARYDVFHFANKDGLRFGDSLHDFAAHRFHAGDEIRLLKRLGKKIVYTNNGCLDGVAQSSFRQWEPWPTCDWCRWRDEPEICSDAGNLAWGALRNELADYQCLLGGNRADFNVDASVHEVPEAYCLDPDRWAPGIEIPAEHRLAPKGETLRVYHSVGGLARRSKGAELRNIKSTHVIRPLVKRLAAEGHDIELVFVHDVSNDEARHVMAQCDVVVDSLVFGMYGSNGREAMALGKPVVQFIRDEWLDQARAEVPEWADALPIVSATEATIEAELLDLLAHPERRAEIGARSREFAVRWHSAAAAARRFDGIYRELLAA